MSLSRKPKSGRGPVPIVSSPPGAWPTVQHREKEEGPRDGAIPEPRQRIVATVVTQGFHPGFVGQKLAEETGLYWVFSDQKTSVT